MDTLVTPLRITSLIARNIVPVAGVLVLGWSAGSLLVLYFVDTLLAFAGVVLLVARHITGMNEPGRRAGPRNGLLAWMRVALGALLGALLICLPLGVPLFMLLAELSWSPSAAFADRAFITALALQVAGSVMGCAQAHRELLARDDDEHVLKHRAAFIIARWMVVLVVAMTGIASLLGPWMGGALVVLAYASATVYFELFPRRALHWLNPKEATADERARIVSAPRQKRVR
jgi:hypothetical protein